jgi:3-hydroxyisobutyrate dehydrogenase-like beta-hydroxyacid dehydrogenase
MTMMMLTSSLSLGLLAVAVGDSWASMQRFPDNILTRGFDYGFRLSLLQKDIRTACKMAAGVGYAVHALESSHCAFSPAYCVCVCGHV